MPNIPIVHEIVETLSLNLPEITSIIIDQSEPQNIIRLSPELVTAANLDIAVKLVEQKARAFKPQDDRVVGQVDMIKSALSVLSFTEQIPAIKVGKEGKHFNAFRKCLRSGFTSFNLLGFDSLGTGRSPTGSKPRTRLKKFT